MLKQLIIISLILTSYSKNSFAASSRVVAIGPAINSVILALNAESQVVGVDNQSTYLYSTKQVSDIGYLQNLSLEGILALKPDLCITTPEASPAKVINELGQFRVKTVKLNPINSSNDVYNNISLIGNILEKKPQADRLKEKISQQVRLALAKIPAHTKQKALILLQISSNSIFLVGTKTHGDFWLKQLKIDNIISFNGLRTASKEGLLTLKPDLIILVKVANNLLMPYQHEIDTLIKQNKAHAIEINSKVLEGFGADFGTSLNTLVEKIYNVK